MAEWAIIEAGGSAMKARSAVESTPMFEIDGVREVREKREEAKLDAFGRYMRRDWTMRAGA